TACPKEPVLEGCVSKTDLSGAVHQILRWHYQCCTRHRAATRRLMRSADAPPLGTIRSLAYFLPVIEEVLGFASTPSTSTISPIQAVTPQFYPVGSRLTARHAQLGRG